MLAGSDAVEGAVGELLGKCSTLLADWPPKVKANR
jgi:hypothetical protein